MRHRGGMSDAPVPDAVLSQLARTGVVRAAINLSNALLVTGRSGGGDPEGVAPDLAAAIAGRLGVGIRYVPFASPSLVADAADDGVWDVALIANEPQRAQRIAFTAGYATIEATYLVRAGSRLESIAEVDPPGVRIAVGAGSAYHLWLERNLRHAKLVPLPLDQAMARFFDGGIGGSDGGIDGSDGGIDGSVGGIDGVDVLAGLRPQLGAAALAAPGSRVLDGHFSAVQQAVGTTKGNAEAARFLADFVEQAKASGLIGALIARHGVQGLSVAEAARPPRPAPGVAHNGAPS